MARHIRSFIMAILLVGCLHSSTLALTDEEAFSQFQFNFITPGARATAMGGTFVGLADDATAVESNPAGLTQLLEPEVSAELKYITYTTKQIFENISFETDITRKKFDNSVISIPFASVVYPYKRFVFSAYRQELVNYESSYRTGAYSIQIIPTNYFFYPTDASVELTVVNYGVGSAVQLLEGLSLAVSPRWSQMNLKSHSARYHSYYDGLPTDFSDDELVSKTMIDDDDSGFSINAGLMWNLHPKVSFGAVYKSGAKFVVTERGRGSGFSILDPNDDTYAQDLAQFTLKVPDSFGAGVAFRVTDVLTCTVDVVHIRYQDLLKDFDRFLGVYTGTNKDNYTVDNATEIHVGIEYILLLDERPLALRAGIYNEPDHTIRFTGTTGDTENDAAQRALFPGGNDQIHVTGGLGLVLNDHFQIDTAANISENNMQFSVSAVYRF